MKKILYLTQAYPYPAYGGGKIKTLNTLKALSKQYKIFAIFVSEYNPTKKEKAMLEKLDINVKVFYSKKILESVKDNLLNLAWNFARGIPHYKFQYAFEPAFPYITRAIKTFKPDVIHVDHLNLTQYVPPKKNAVLILEHHNLEHYLMWTRFVNTKKLTRKAYLLAETILTYFYELRTIKKFNHVFAISDEENTRTRKSFYLKNVTTQPLVYPPANVIKKKTKNPTIIFVGMVTWPPNEDSVEWFLTEMYPRIKNKVPKVEFHIVGKTTPELERKMPKLPGVCFYGHQRSLKKFLEGADVFVLPFRMGGGVRIKALTALANGIPIVTTPMGVEGLKVKQESECLIAKNPVGFAESVVTLLKSENLRKKLTRNGLSYMKSHHGEDKNKLFLEEYRKVIEKFTNRNSN